MYLSHHFLRILLTLTVHGWCVYGETQELMTALEMTITIYLVFHKGPSFLFLLYVNDIATNEAFCR